MVEARLWRLVVEIEWLNCFPSVSLWANCMYSPIRSIYIRLFEQSDCLALLLTNVLACNTVSFAWYFSPLWSIQSCIMVFKEFIYPHNLSFEPISVPFISAWDCVLKLFTEKHEKRNPGLPWWPPFLPEAQTLIVAGHDQKLKQLWRLTFSALVMLLLIYRTFSCSGGRFCWRSKYPRYYLP